MKSFHKTIVSIAAAMIFASASNAQDQALQISAAPSIYRGAYESLVKAFEASHPDIKVLLAPPVREDEELLQNTLRSAITGQLPDILFISPNVLRPLIDHKVAVDLATVGGSADTVSKLGLVAGATEVGTVDGRLYALPLGVSVPIIAYNADLVAKAGGNVDDFPQSWEGIISLMNNVAKLDGKLGGFMEYDNTGNWTYKAVVSTLGGSMMSLDGRSVAFDSAEGRQAFKVLEAFGRAGQAKADMSRDQARQAFAAGTIGILVTSSGALPSLEKQSAGKFALRASPLPLEEDVARVPAAGTVLVITAKDPAKKAAALEFLTYAVSADAQTIIGKMTGLLAVNQTALTDPARLGEQTQQRPNQKAAIAEMGRLTEWYAFPGENSVKITEVIKNYLRAVLTLKRSPDDALTAMKSDVEALLPR
ncbi:hypothetical protein BJF93_09000 [Xaviernesmea oryzae]|uniref:Uncharacterized protein n=1 Tax=Xaviernesmea oryzae TaxID=464029 RepID=A0A1Q9B3Q2_9HYPH|nr:extracellular solute-binding protein [Xaviernesmea oryzae]OLP62676.1 hypothetical protein BJF93_09000 [Xaviernesmea oryzae]SEM36125.1 multiple sugar transport system substrate-binding protein [Xaviernesmea oryzae]